MSAIEPHTLTKRGCPPLAGILLALGIVLAAIAIQGYAGLAEVLQWQRGAAPGVSWLTGHLTHWSWNHLAWDLFAFAILSWLSLSLAPSRYAPCLLVAAVLILLEVRLFQAMLDCYRGLSGLDCALFGLVIGALWRQPSGDRGGRAAHGLALLGGCAFLVKTAFELVTGGTLFVEAGAVGFVPVVSAHLTGFLCGLAAGLFPRKEDGLAGCETHGFGAESRAKGTVKQDRRVRANHRYV
jgi:hypothetical protein